MVSIIIMRSLLSFAMLFALAGAAAGQNVTFDGQRFVLAYAPKDSPVNIREYLPPGETLDKWTRMLSSRTFKNLNDPEAYARKLAQSVTEGDPAARSQILRSDKTGAYVVDFLVFSPEGSGPRFAEWNLMRVDRQTIGLRVVQYAQRFYTIDDSMPKEIIAARDKILPQLEKLSLP